MRLIGQAIEAFADTCERDESTDSGEAWELLEAIRKVCASRGAKAAALRSLRSFVIHNNAVRRNAAAE